MDITPSYGRTEWVDDMKTLFKQAGVDKLQQVFAITMEEARTCEGAIDDICSITNSGEVPNLYNLDDLEEI